MQEEILTVEMLMKLETWEVALRVIRDSDDLYETQLALQNEFQVNFDDIESVLELPDDSLRDFKEKIVFTTTEVLDENAATLHEKICVEFDYCNKRNTLGAIALEAAVFALDIAQTGGIAYLIFFGFRRGFFDRLCECDS